MKALAAASIGQYGKSARAPGDYYRTVELGLGACFRENPKAEAQVVANTRSPKPALGRKGKTR